MNRRAVGNEYEERAVEYLRAKGMRILERNFRTRYGEIDLIAMDGGCLVFTEVKYRKDSRRGTALEAVDIRKQRKIIQMARFYLLRYGYATDTPCRFDVVGITGEKIEHVENAFWAQG